jgi:hypothetical protein
MCWLDPDPDSPGACLVCATIARFHSSTIHKPISDLDEAFDADFCQDTMLPETTRHVYVDLLKAEANLGPRKRQADDMDSGSEEDDDKTEPVPVSRTTGRRVISNAPPPPKKSVYDDDAPTESDSDDDDGNIGRDMGDDNDADQDSGDEADKPPRSYARSMSPTDMSTKFVDGDESDDDNDARSEVTTSSAKYAATPPFKVPKMRRGKQPMKAPPPKRRVLTNAPPTFSDPWKESLNKEFDGVADDGGPVKPTYDGRPIFHTRDVNKTRFSPASENLDPTLSRAAALATVPLGVRRLLRFIDVLDIFTAPWAPEQFLENEGILKQLIATHLKLIVGKNEWKKHKSRLFAILDTDIELARKQHIVWITNRQQGKTSTLSKFLAVMAYLSPTGGSLIYVYSTSRDRAQELIDASRKYLWWARTTPEIADKLATYGLEVPQFKSNNASGFRMQSATNSVAVNLIKARPKSVESCRGDAPHSAFIDEIAFVTEVWWCVVFIPIVFRRTPQSLAPMV